MLHLRLEGIGGSDLIFISLLQIGGPWLLLTYLSAVCPLSGPQYKSLVSRDNNESLLTSLRFTFPSVCKLEMLSDQQMCLSLFLIKKLEVRLYCRSMTDMIWVFSKNCSQVWVVKTPAAESPQL